MFSRSEIRKSRLAVGTAPVAAGSVVATGTSHTVVAVPKAGVVVQQGATTTWTFTFTKVACVTPPFSWRYDFIEEALLLVGAAAGIARSRVRKPGMPRRRRRWRRLRQPWW